jgi:DNA-binding LacI/PurR family transcriptional regulator
LLEFSKLQPKAVVLGCLPSGDDLREATVFTRKLTTIRVEKKKFAEAFVRLIQLIIANNQPETSKILVDTTVVEK